MHNDTLFLRGFCYQHRSQKQACFGQLWHTFGIANEITKTTPGEKCLWSQSIPYIASFCFKKLRIFNFCLN